MGRFGENVPSLSLNWYKEISLPKPTADTSKPNPMQPNHNTKNSETVTN